MGDEGESGRVVLGVCDEGESATNVLRVCDEGEGEGAGVKRAV